MDWLTHLVNQSEAWVSKHVYFQNYYVVKVLAHDPGTKCFSGFAAPFSDFLHTVMTMESSGWYSLIKKNEDVG